MCVKFIPYMGGKATLASAQLPYFPKDGFDISWETNAGTAAMTANLFCGMGLDKMEATELDHGMATLLRVVRDEPIQLMERLQDFPYNRESFEWALKINPSDNRSSADLEIATAKFVLHAMSINGKGMKGSYRSIDSRSDDIKRFETSRRFEREFQKLVGGIHRYSQLIQNLEIIEDDMLQYFWRRCRDNRRFIYCDVPYINSLRAQKLYAQETDLGWHEAFIKKLSEESKKGNVTAPVMLCGYANLDDLKNDFYSQQLLPAGWRLYGYKDLLSPSAKKGGKQKRVECIWINYEPIAPDETKQYSFIK